MSNHFHIVVKILPDKIDQLSNEEVAERWGSLFKGPILVQRWQAGESLCSAELQTVDDCIKLYRKRLASLSWFMRCLNEPIARQANKEDSCTGHFWESRFKSQALLSEEALLSCMAYVDLNPVRANIAITPEASEYTSIKERIKPTFSLDLATQEQIENQNLLRFTIAAKPLARFEGNEKNDQHKGILFSLVDYLKLVDFTGRIIRPDKRGAIPNNLTPILERMGIDLETWLTNTTEFDSIYCKRFAKPRKRKRFANIA